MASVQLCLLVDLGEIMFFVRIVLLLFLPSFSVSENVDTSLGREKGQYHIYVASQKEASHKE